MEEHRFARTWEALRAAVHEGVAPGFVAGLWDARESDRFRYAFVGQRRLAPSAQPMLPETVFDLASLTKVMGTATLAATLVDRRWINWNTPLGAILPQANHSGVLLSHLLSHTAGFVAWRPLWDSLRKQFAPTPLYEVSVSARQKAMRERVFSITPDVAPGMRAVYSDISFLLLGFALEEVTGMSLDRAVEKFVWEPMGLRDAFFRHVTTDAASARLDFVAATEDSAWRGGVLQGQVHDENTWAMGGYAGHAGAFGTVRDVMHFARSLVPYRGSRGFLSAESLHAAWTSVAEPLGCSRTLGWDTPSGELPSAGLKFSKRSVGHLGFTGTSLWIDRDAGIAVTLLSNRVHPTREDPSGPDGLPQGTPKIRAFRPRFHDALRADLGL